MNELKKLLDSGNRLGAISDSSDIQEMLACIVDIFDDFLDSKSVTIPNEDRDRDDPEYGANIYGLDYAEVTEKLFYLLQDWGVFDKDASF